MIEVSYYFFLAIIANVLGLSRKILIKKYIFFVLWGSTYIGLALIVRTKYDTDIITYVESMLSYSKDFYYIREPVVWLGQRYLYAIIKNSQLVFIIYDVIGGLFLYRALRNLNVPNYVFYSIIVFFPFILGMQNVYRQWLSVIIFLYAFSLNYTNSTKAKSLLFYIISVLTHNAVAIFLPLLFLHKKYNNYKLLWLISLVVSLLGIYFGAETKSISNKGLDLGLAYLIVISFCLVMLIYATHGKINSSNVYSYLYFLSLIIILLFSISYLSIIAGERIALFSYMLMYPVLALIIEKNFNQVIFLRILFVNLGFLPIFFFPTSQFLF